MGDLLGGSHDCDPQRLAVGLGWPTGGGDGGGPKNRSCGWMASHWPGTVPECERVTALKAGLKMFILDLVGKAE